MNIFAIASLKMSHLNILMAYLFISLMNPSEINLQEQVNSLNISPLMILQRKKRFMEYQLMPKEVFSTFSFQLRILIMHTKQELNLMEFDIK